MAYLVHLRQFEGPLGLLLYLIRKEEMDVMDINIYEITKQYLEYIRLMKELDLEVAGEFIAMAATLIHIKSKMLLPQYDETGELVEQEDPRRELVQKLLEYQRYQGAGKDLYSRVLLNRDVWARGIREEFEAFDDEIIITEENGLFSLIGSYRSALKNMKKAVHQVRAKVQSIASRVMEIKDHLVVGRKVLLRDLLPSGTEYRQKLLITFLSVLELGRMGFVSLFQNEVYGDIHIESKRSIDGNVLERVQEFDSANAAAVAESIMSEAMEDVLINEEFIEENPTEVVAEADTALSATDEEIEQAERELT